jgi:hypothetical protein
MTQTGLGHGWTAEAVAFHQRWLAEFLDSGDRRQNNFSGSELKQVSMLLDH